MVPHELISQTVTEWITGLNYQYMVVVLVICYGLKYKRSLSWLNNRVGGEVAAQWLVGLIIALSELITVLPYFGDNTISISSFSCYFILSRKRYH